MRKRKSKLASGSAFSAFAAGAVASYFFDARNGARRRAQVSDKIVHLRNVAKQQFTYRKHDLSNRAHGLVAEMRKRLSETETDDDVLTERVRAKLGHVCSHAHSIEVHPKGKGVIELKGPVLASERARVLTAIRAVAGVHGIDDDLEPRERSEGFWPRHGPRSFTS